ncbi:Lipopolysaccharide export system ATP-binding protein LptB [Moorella humiferrea]|uniref:ABC transporter ATP-binding protein n=1 Tax=Neomoorella humiferrea TaxID=676965 RepID=UPI0030CCB183
MAEAILQLKNISKRFGGLQAIKDVSFDVHEGEIVGVIGPNGAGKSTIFNLITGYYRIDTGSITYYGKEIVGLTPDAICKLGIARTFQIARPFGGLTVFDNILIGLLPKCKTINEARKGVLAILERINLEPKAFSFGKDLTTLERKRLELGRALATRPKILLLDEVMTGLKPKEMDEIIELIRELKKHMSIVVVEHVMRVIMKISDRVIVLDHGQKIAEGTPVEITNNPKVISAYLGRGGNNA